MAGIFQRNKLFDEHNWIGVLEMPELGVDVYGQDTSEMADSIDFEICLDDWWPWFTADEGI